MASEQGGEKTDDFRIHHLRKALHLYCEAGRAIREGGATPERTKSFDGHGFGLAMACCQHLTKVLDELADLRARLAAAEGEREEWARSIYGIISFAPGDPMRLSDRDVARLREIADGLRTPSPAKPGDAPAPGDGGAGVGDAGE